MNMMHSNRCMVPIWNARYRHQPRLGKIIYRKIYFIVWTIYKLWKTNEHTILKLWTLIKNIIESTHKFHYNILFTFLMDRGRATNGIGHLMISSLCYGAGPSEFCPPRIDQNIVTTRAEFGIAFYRSYKQHGIRANTKSSQSKLLSNENMAHIYINFTKNNKH